MSLDPSEIQNLPQIKTCVVNFVALSLVSLERCEINYFNQKGF